MKKLILTFGVFLAGIFFVNAQDKTDKATKLMNNITKICSLTPDQVTKIKPITEGFIKTQEANKQQYANDPNGLTAANKASMKDYKTKLDAILTPEQEEKLKEANQARKAKMKAAQTGKTTNSNDPQ